VESGPVTSISLYLNYEKLLQSTWLLLTADVLDTISTHAYTALHITTG